MRREVLCKTVVLHFSEPAALEKKSFETFSGSKLWLGSPIPNFKGN